jgi:hypothetical protein
MKCNHVNVMIDVALPYQVGLKWTPVQTLTSLRKQVREGFARIHSDAGTRECVLPNAVKLLGSSMKVEMGESAGVLSTVLYLSPADEAFADNRTLCPFATTCADVCLGHSSGQLAFDHARNARTWKTTLFMGDRDLFARLIMLESISHVRKARRLGMTPAIRVDGSSDTGFGAKLAHALWESGFKDARVYDYTKVEQRAIKWARGGFTPNYHVTFSRSGDNEQSVQNVLNAGGNVAAVFSAKPGRKNRKAEPLPDTYKGSAIIDGDYLHGDARFLDPRSERGTVVGLRFKQNKARTKAIANAGAFVINV